MGSRGDAYDHALAETINGLYQTEVIRHRGPWKGLDDVELATLEWVAWYNTERLMGPLGYVPPAEYEEQFHRAQTDIPVPALNEPSLRQTRGGSWWRRWTINRTARCSIPRVDPAAVIVASPLGGADACGLNRNSCTARSLSAPQYRVSRRGCRA